MAKIFSAAVIAAAATAAAKLIKDKKIAPAMVAKKPQTH